MSDLLFCLLVTGFFKKERGNPADTKTSSSDWRTDHPTVKNMHVLVIYNHLFVWEGFFLFLPGPLAVYTQKGMVLSR